jgi:monoamine oxidase
VGAGFGGLATAYFLAGCGFEVVVLEAQDHVGGRVSTDANFVPGRLVEAGAELIGFNHALWLGLAGVFGLGFTMCTDDNDYAQLGLSSPVFLDGRMLTPADVDDAFAHMDEAFATLNVMAKHVDAYAPWNSRAAAALDARSIADWKQWLELPELVDAAIEVVLGNDNVLPTEQQSLLGFLAQIKGGGGSRFWSDTEVMKCADGNQALATRLADALAAHDPGSIRLNAAVGAIEISDDKVAVTTADRGREEADFVVLAVPPTVWDRIAITPTIPDGYRMGTGPGVKFLSEVRTRFWLDEQKAPTALDEIIGETWEATDNQAAAGGSFDISVFAGGTSADTALGLDPDRRQQWYADELDQLFPGYKDNVGATRFVAWPDHEWVRCGYSSPGPGQVTTVAPLLAQPFNDRLVFAGEHVNPCFFGYMEGALQSGLLAMGHIAEACGLFEHGRVVEALTAAVDAGWND